MTKFYKSNPLPKGIYLILIFIFTAFTCLKVNAQILIGAKTGARMSWLTYDALDTEEFKAKPFFGYSVGITTAFKVKKRFFLELDILYSRQGKTIEGKNEPPLKNVGIYHYINTPVIYRVDFINSVWNTQFKWFLGIGPNVNFWWKGNGRLKAEELKEVNIEELEYEIKFEEFPASPDPRTLYYGDVNRVQVGLVMAAGLVFEPRPNQSILVEFRYELGHSYMAKGPGIFTDAIAYQDNLKARNHGIQLSISYLIDIKSDGKKEKRLYYQQ